MPVQPCKSRFAQMAAASLLALCAVWLVVCWVNAQGATATMRFSPSNRDVAPQSASTTTVIIENALDLGAFQFNLLFDPTVLRVDDVTLGDLLGSTGRNVSELGPVISNTAGSVTYGAFSFGSQHGPSGTGTLAIIAFTSLITPGTSALSLQNAQIINTSAHTQPVQAVSGSVTVMTGPRIGAPDFASSVFSDELLTVTTRITNTTSSTGVSTATLRYGYTFPYTQSSVAGNGPGGNGNGEWRFVISPQGSGHVGQMLRFSILAWDGDVPPDETVNDNAGAYFAATVTDRQTPPPVASFAASPRAGAPPLTVYFTDTSTGTVTSWLWQFGDGATSAAQNPPHTYALTGTFDVTLTVTGPGGSSTRFEPGYIRIRYGPVANFDASPRSGNAPLNVQFTDLSSGATNWLWSFGDTFTSSLQNPMHTYNLTGTYTISLWASGPGGDDSLTRTGYITTTKAWWRVYLPVIVRNP